MQEGTVKKVNIAPKEIKGDNKEMNELFTRRGSNCMNILLFLNVFHYMHGLFLII